MATAVYESMVPAAQDPLQALLVKAAYWAQSAAEAGGGPYTDGMYENMTPFAQDPIQVLTAKLAYWLQQISIGGGGGGGGAVQIYTGGSPPAAPDNPALPALYYPTGGGTIKEWDGAAWV